MRKILEIVLIAFSTIAFIQDGIAQRNVIYNFIFSSGVEYGNFSNFNHQLVEDSLNFIENEQLFISAGLFIKDSTRNEYSTLNFIFTTPYINGSNQSKYYSWHFEYGYSYVIFQKQKYSLYPKVYLGISKAGIEVLQKNIDVNQIDDNLSIGNCSRFYSNALIYTGLGVGFDRKFYLKFTNFVLGANFCYFLPLNKLIWDSPDGHRVVDFPNIKITGYRVELFFRWSFFSNKNNI